MSQGISSQTSFLRDLEVDVQVGMHPWEQHPERPTRLLISVEMTSDVLVSFQPGTAHGYIDYDLVRNHIRSFRDRPHTLLLEELIRDIIGFCMQLDHLTSCTVSIQKPDIFNDVQSAGVQVAITRAEYNRLAAGERL